MATVPMFWVALVAGWQDGGGFDELVTVVFIAFLVNPILQGPKMIDVDCVDISK
jgi:hypothetical protein